MKFNLFNLCISFTYISLFNPHNNPVRKLQSYKVLPSFYDEELMHMRLSVWSKIIKLKMAEPGFEPKQSDIRNLPFITSSKLPLEGDGPSDIPLLNHCISSIFPSTPLK